MRKRWFLSAFAMSCMLFAQGICGETFDVKLKGFDDGRKTNRQQDHHEALIDAKRQAVERAGVNIESYSKVKNFVLFEDWIESKSKAALLPGFDVIDVGYQADGNYCVVLIGMVKTLQEESGSGKAAAGIDLPTEPITFRCFANQVQSVVRSITNTGKGTLAISIRSSNREHFYSDIAQVSIPRKESRDIKFVFNPLGQKGVKRGRFTVESDAGAFNITAVGEVPTTDPSKLGFLGRIDCKLHPSFGEIVPDRCTVKLKISSPMLFHDHIEEVELDENFCYHLNKYAVYDPQNTIHISYMGLKIAGTKNTITFDPGQSFANVVLEDQYTNTTAQDSSGKVLLKLYYLDTMLFEIDAKGGIKNLRVSQPPKEEVADLRKRYFK